MEVKELDKSHTDLIVKLYQTDFPDGWNKEMILSAFETGRFHAEGIFDNGILTGVITFSVAIDQCDIEDFVVQNYARGRGYGKILLTHALDTMKNIGIKKVFLEVRENNKNAISLYEKFGFKIISKRNKYYSDMENALVMIKEICGC